MAEPKRSAPPWSTTAAGASPQPLNPMYNVLPPADQELQLWAQSQPELEDAENSQREWSEENFARWLASPQNGILGSLPLIILTRTKGGFKDGNSDVPAAQMEQERQQGQARLALLSTNSKQIRVGSGHNMELEAPEEVTAAIREVIDAVRHHREL